MAVHPDFDPVGARPRRNSGKKETLLPLLDFDLLLGRVERPLRRTARILVVRSAESQAAETHSAKLGLLVQRVLGSEQLEIDRSVACAEQTSMSRAADRPPESGPTPETGDPLGTPPSGRAASTVDPVRTMNLQSLLGPVVLTPTGMVQLIRVDGIPTPELS